MKDLLERLLDERDARNVDNVARTASYLELYAHTVASPPDLPWVLMAHLVSRNAGYLMTGLADTIRYVEEHRPPGADLAQLHDLFLFLERANYLIFHDAWHHVITARLGRPLDERTPRFMREAWARHFARPPTAESERRLVFDLVHNEQHYIERRVVWNPRFARALALVNLIELFGREKPIAMPHAGAEIRVGGFASLQRRIATGRRLFDEVLADRDRRRRIFEWALRNPHTGDRAVAGFRPTPLLRAVWPVERVRALDPGVHAEPEPDPRYP